MNRNFLMLGALTACTAMVFSCKGPAPSGPPPGGPVPVNISVVKQQEAVYYDLYPANVIALNQVDLRTQVNGYISNIFFTEGQTVKKGQKLYEVEPTRYVAAYAQSNSSLGIARSNYEKAKKDADRYTQLGKEDAVSRQRVEYAQTDLQNAKQQLASAEAQVASTSNDLRHATITAPFDGTIGISQVKLGTFVTAGQTLLNTVSSDDPISVDFVISEKEIIRFMELNKRVTKDTLFSILLPDKSIYPYPGKIQFFDRAVDPQSGTLKIRLQFPNPERQLKAGMSCDLRVLNKSGKNSLIVPFKAVTEQMGEYFVYVVEKDTARQRKVAIGPAVGNNVIIFNGLTEGERFVIEGIQKLKEGSPVQEGMPQQPGQPGVPQAGPPKK